MENKNYDIFLAHKNPDKNFMEEIKKELEEVGINVFLDREDMENIERNEEYIAKSLYVLLYLSPHALPAKGGLKREVEYIKEKFPPEKVWGVINTNGNLGLVEEILEAYELEKSNIPFETQQRKEEIITHILKKSRKILVKKLLNAIERAGKKGTFKDFLKEKGVKWNEDTETFMIESIQSDSSRAEFTFLEEIEKIFRVYNNKEINKIINNFFLLEKKIISSQSRRGKALVKLSFSNKKRIIFQFDIVEIIGEPYQKREELLKALVGIKKSNNVELIDIEPTKDIFSFLEKKVTLGTIKEMFGYYSCNYGNLQYIDTIKTHLSPIAEQIILPLLEDGKKRWDDITPLEKISVLLALGLLINKKLIVIDHLLGEIDADLSERKRVYNLWQKTLENKPASLILSGCISKFPESKKIKVEK
jgi:hypothetical protein